MISGAIVIPMYHRTDGVYATESGYNQSCQNIEDGQKSKYFSSYLNISKL